MKIPFETFRLRTTLLIGFMGFTLLSGLSSTLLNLQLSYTVRSNFIQSAGHHLSHAITKKVNQSLQEGESFVEVAERFSCKMEKNKADYPILLTYLVQNLVINPNLGVIFYTEENTGFTLKVYLKESPGIRFENRSPKRLAGDKIYTEKDVVVEEIYPNGQGKFSSKSFFYPDYPTKPFAMIENTEADYRNSPWYLRGRGLKITDKGEWTNCYSSSRPGAQTGVGFAFATSLFNLENKFAGVLAMDIGTEWINQYLGEAMEEISRTGINIFIVEKHPKGTSMVLAHSSMEEHFPRDANGELQLLSPPLEMKDPAIEKLIKALPSEFTIMTDVIYEKMFPFSSNGLAYTGIVSDVMPHKTPWWILCIQVSEKDLFRKAHWYFYLSLIVLFIIILASAIISIALAQSASRPIEGLMVFADKLGRLDFKSEHGIQSRIIELRSLAHSMNRMKLGLHSFTKYLPRELLKNLIDSGVNAAPGGKEKEVSILFSDIANFTKYSEILPPADLVYQLNEYFGCFTSVIFKNEGIVDKFIGDSVMAYWNAPKDCEQHALKACKTALQAIFNLAILHKKWARLNQPIFHARVGINSGFAVLGNIGTDDYLNYTIIGDSVNLASRLEGLNKEYGTTILITDATLKACGNHVVTRPIDVVKVKGKEKEILVHELIGIAGETPPEREDFCRECKVAFAIYLEKKWAEAMQLFQKIAEKHPEDLSVAFLLKRCKEYLLNPPDAL